MQETLNVILFKMLFDKLSQGFCTDILVLEAAALQSELILSCSEDTASELL